MSYAFFVLRAMNEHPYEISVPKEVVATRVSTVTNILSVIMNTTSS